MPSFSEHHCPICHKVGNQRCLNLGHYVQCPHHHDYYHSTHGLCVRCARETERKTLSEARQRDKENEDPGTIKKTRKQKKAKQGKPAQQKTMKQQRREKRISRKSASSTASDDGDDSK